jgi:cellulose synthase/poly-beta-1,6-N-acetylglucosamine synthase-like glycosyltransferase
VSAGTGRITVVIPACNAEGEIGRCVDAVLAQDVARDRLDVVVVDNRSTDGTAEAARAAGARVVREDRLASSYAARNRGVAEAAGEWVAFTDADCVPQRSWLGTLLAPPVPEQVGAVVGEVVALEAETPVQRLVERHGIMRHGVTLPAKALPCFSTANVAIRTSLLRELGGFREDVRFFGDMEFSWRMQIERGAAILFRPEAVVRHRHRRTWAAFWRQAVQHGRGVAFMKRTYPDRYRISPGRQIGRVLAGPTPAAATADVLWEPVWLTLWYGGLLAGYLRGPAWTPGGGRRAS